MKKNVLLGLALLFSVTLNAQLSTSVQQRLQDTLTYMQSHYHVVGLSACASVKGEGLWKGTSGVSEPGVPLTTDMLIGIGSNTKTFVSAMMLKLEEDGLVNINDTIGTWIQGYDNIDGSITIAQILSHTSGLYNINENPTIVDSINSNPTRIWTKEELLHDFVKAPYFSPGASWHYSNTNYIVAGIIEEQISGRPIDALLRDSIFIPLQLNHTYYLPQQNPTYPMSKFWYNLNYLPYNQPVEIYSLAASSGAIVSNPEDVVHFWKALFNGEIIKMSTLEHEMLHMYYNSSNGYNGYGLGILKAMYPANGQLHPILAHGGTLPGQINENLVDTIHGIIIDVLSNEDSLKNPYVANVVNALYIILLQETTAIHDVSKTNKLVCYPNPANDILYIPNEEHEFRSVKLYDLTGKEVLTQDVVPGSNLIRLSVRHLDQGMYFLKAQTTDGMVESPKIMITH